MSSIQDYFTQAQFSLAAYANLSIGEIVGTNNAALQQAGFSQAQADEFAKHYTVVDQYSDATGVSATVFADASGNKYLAVRGTEGLTDYLTDLVDVTLLGTNSSFQWQYASVKSKVNEWIGNGTLPSSFTVTGHSLGGYLATGIAGDFAGNELKGSCSNSFHKLFYPVIQCDRIKASHSFRCSYQPPQ
jgi:hypothetical protein